MDPSRRRVPDANRPWEGRAVLHVDMDAFFASVEQLDHPEWRGLPVIVGGAAGKRGVVAAASYEARAFGVRSAMPSAQAHRLCPDAIWTRGSFDRYGEVSSSVMRILRDVTPGVQQVSIDEAYLDATPGAHGEHPVEIAAAVRAQVATLGLTCSVGVATSRTVAKIASEEDKPDGLTVVWPGEEGTFLAPMPVRALPGIGPKSAAHLTALGIRTLGDLAALDDPTAERLLGSHGPEMARRAAGVDLRPVLEPAPAKSVSAERTFAEDMRTARELSDAMHGLAARVGSRLRAKGLAGRTVTLKIRYGDFTTRTLRETLHSATDLDPDIARVGMGLLNTAWREGVGIRLLGVGMSGFEGRPEQLDLLAEADADDPRVRAVTRSIDAVRERFGDGALRRGPGSVERNEEERYGPG